MPLYLVLKLLFYATSWTLSYTIPMSALLSVIIAVGNLNQRSEIIAMRAAGIHFFSILKPYIFLGVIFTSLLYLHQQKVVSQSFRNMEKVFHEIYNHDIIAFIRPGIFTSLDKSSEQQRIIYVEKKESRDNHDVLKNVQIKTIRQSPQGKRVVQFIIAKEGIKIKKTSPDGKDVKALRLFQGYAVMQDRDDNEAQMIDFNHGSFDLHLAALTNQKQLSDSRGVRELNDEELIQKYEELRKKNHPPQQYLRYLTEYHRRIALSFSVLFFVLLGFPLSIVSQRTGKGFGLGLSVVFIFLYYTFFLSTDTIAIKYSLLPASLAAWSGNFMICSIAIYFMKKRL